MLRAVCGLCLRFHEARTELFFIEVRLPFRAFRRPDASYVADWDGIPERIEVTLKVACRQPSPGSGRTIEFSALERTLGKVIEELDGKRLHDMDIFARKNPSLENIAQFIANKVDTLLMTSGPVRVHEVILTVPTGQKVTYQT